MNKDIVYKHMTSSTQVIGKTTALSDMTHLVSEMNFSKNSANL